MASPINLVDEHLSRGLHTLTSFRQPDETQQPRDAPRRSHESGMDTITVVAPARQSTDWRWFLAYTTVTWLPTTAWVLLLLRKVTSTQPRWPHTWAQAFTPTWLTHPLQLMIAVWMWTTAVRWCTQCGRPVDDTGVVLPHQASKTTPVHVHTHTLYIYIYI